MNKTWIRILYVTFSPYNVTSESKSLVIGKTCDDERKPKIEISGSKYLSPLKDNFTIRIYNMTYKQLLQISLRQLYRVRVYCGYLGNGNMFSPTGECLFDGGLMNMTNEKKDFKDNVGIFVCGSHMMARAQQFRLSISYNSGINMYSAVKYMGRMSGIKSMNISKSMKDDIQRELDNATTSPGDYLAKIGASRNGYFMNVDSSRGAEVNFWNIYKDETTKWNIDPKAGMMITTPEITSNGLTFDSLPVVNYMPGQAIKIDNSWIDVTSGQDSFSESMSATNTTYLNADGLYLIYRLSYSLSNTTGQFRVHLTCWSKKIFDNVTGVTK